MKIQKRERTTADKRWQRKQEMGLDSEHSEKTRGGRVFSGKEVEGIIGRRTRTRGLRSA